jgi:predicted RNA-binding protein with RPS1 domain
MKDKIHALKKVVSVHGVPVEMYSIDHGVTWSTSLRELQRREKRREKRRKKEVAYAKRIFKKSYLNQF